MNSIAILGAVVVVTIFGDYFIKLASVKPDGLTSPLLLLGALFYATSAVGWYFLMKIHSLAAIGALYSAATILVLAALGFFVFKEAIGLREGIGIALALLAVAVLSYDA